DQHPTIWHREITTPTRPQHPPQFAQVETLDVAITHVFNHMIANNDIKTRVFERQNDSVNQVEPESTYHLPCVDNVDRIDITSNFRVRPEVVGNPPGPCSNF